VPRPHRRRRINIVPAVTRQDLRLTFDHARKPRTVLKGLLANRHTLRPAATTCALPLVCAASQRWRPRNARSSLGDELLPPQSDESGRGSLEAMIQ
jgi:hypothetical protein